MPTANLGHDDFAVTPRRREEPNALEGAGRQPELSVLFNEGGVGVVVRLVEPEQSWPTTAGEHDVAQLFAEQA